MNTECNTEPEVIEYILLPEVKKLVGLGTTKIYTMARMI